MDHEKDVEEGDEDEITILRYRVWQWRLRLRLIKELVAQEEHHEFLKGMSKLERKWYVIEEIDELIDRVTSGLGHPF